MSGLINYDHIEVAIEAFNLNQLEPESISAETVKGRAWEAGFSAYPFNAPPKQITLTPILNEGWEEGWQAALVRDRESARKEREDAKAAL